MLTKDYKEVSKEYLLSIWKYWNCPVCRGCFTKIGVSIQVNSAYKILGVCLETLQSSQQS